MEVVITVPELVVIMVEAMACGSECKYKLRWMVVVSGAMWCIGRRAQWSCSQCTAVVAVLRVASVVRVVDGANACCQVSVSTPAASALCRTRYPA